jgi:hypothetical protein
MTREEFIKSIEGIYAEGVKIIGGKNQDYAGQSDPWANFRWSEIAGVDVPHAIMVRVLDKMARISNLLKRESVIKDERIEDTVLDSINYLAILLSYLNEQQKMKKQNEKD